MGTPERYRKRLIPRATSLRASQIFCGSLLHHHTSPEESLGEFAPRDGHGAGIPFRLAYFRKEGGRLMKLSKAEGQRKLSQILTAKRKEVCMSGLGTLERRARFVFIPKKVLGSETHTYIFMLLFPSPLPLPPRFSGRWSPALGQRTFAKKLPPASVRATRGGRNTQQFSAVSDFIVLRFRAVFSLELRILVLIFLFFGRLVLPPDVDVTYLNLPQQRAGKKTNPHHWTHTQKTAPL